MADTSLIQQIRTASRLMVRELGFMNTTLAATHYSPSAVHTLLEVSVRGAMTAAQLVTLLGLEKSSVSRMVARLLAAGELEERPCAEDARSKSLALTAKGHDTVAMINAWATRRVVEALGHLDEPQQRTVASGLAAYAQALAQCRDTALADTTPQISLVTGYQPGMIGRIAQMHGEYYARHHDFGAFLKARLPAAWRNLPPGFPRRPTRSGWRCARGRLSVRWRSMARISASSRRIYAGSFSMTAVGEPALAGGSSVRRWLSAIVVSSAPFSCGRLKVWTRPANCMSPLASR